MPRSYSNAGTSKNSPLRKKPSFLLIERGTPHMMKSLRVGLAVVLTSGMGANAFAIGGDFIGNEVPSARAAGEGYVGVAGQNNDPTAVFSNPAAMTALKGTQATLGMTWENIHGDFQDVAGNETKERVTN